MRVDSDGEEILRHLLETNTEFKRFYDEIFKKKIGSIGWIYESNMPPGLAAYYHAGEKAIHYKNYPVSIKDAYLMAHEIMHAVRDKEIDLLVVRCSAREYEYLGTSLKSLLEDQNVDRILKDQYNIDLLPCYMASINYVEGRPGTEPKETIYRIWKGLVLANTMLKWDLITNQDALERWRDHLKWYRNQYPNVYRMGKNMAKIIRRMGLADVEKHRDIAIKLIDKYDLNETLFV